jgi:hypothetical protein
VESPLTATDFSPMLPDILADDIAVFIERGLSCDEDDAAGADVDDLRIAGRGAEFGRVDPDDRRRGVACHSGDPH